MTLGTVHFDTGAGSACGIEGLTSDNEYDVTCGDCDLILARDAEEDRERFDAVEWYAAESLVHFNLGGGNSCGAAGDLTTEREHEVTCAECALIIKRNAAETRKWLDEVLEHERKQLDF